MNKLFLLFSLLIISVYSYSKKQKQKVHGCLLLFKERKIQNPQIFEYLLEKLSPVMEDAEQKISMYAITTCYSRISDEQADAIVNDFTNKRIVNSLTEENVNLLSLENLGQEEYENFSDTMEEFMLVFNEVFNEMKGIKSEEDKWYESNLFIIILCIVLVNGCIIIYTCCCKRKHKRQINDEKKKE